MQFDYTYITIFGFILFEPLIALTNFIMLLSTLYYYSQLKKFETRFSRQFALFILLTGLTGIFGTLAHGVHYQWGDRFFNVVLFLMNLTSLLSVLFCFFGVYSYLKQESDKANRVSWMAWAWMAVVTYYTLIYNEFTVVKVHVGVVSAFTLIAFSMKRIKDDPGSKFIVSGILLAMLAVLVHTLHIRFHDWFNHKDLAHVIMLFGLYKFFRGVELNSHYVTGQFDAVSKEQSNDEN